MIHFVQNPTLGNFNFALHLDILKVTDQMRIFLRQDFTKIFLKLIEG